jgi:hypothetical protein
LLIGLVLLGLGAITDVVPWLTRVETAAVIDVAWGALGFGACC